MFRKLTVFLVSAVPVMVLLEGDVKELADFLADEHATVKDAIAKGVTLDQALKTVTLDKYKDWRNYGRREQEIRSLYELIQTGKRSYFD